MTQPDLLGQVHVAVIRLDGKVDDLREQNTEFKDLYKDHELRVRALEAGYPLLARVAALETAYHELAARPYVSPATVWRALGFTLGVVTFLSSIALAVLK